MMNLQESMHKILADVLTRCMFFIWTNSSMINTFKRHQELILIATHGQQAGRSALLLQTWQQAVQHCSLISLLD